MPLQTIKYKRDDLTIVWEPAKCVHSGICARGLSKVFDPKRKPWIDLSLAERSQIEAQVAKCPSGALSFNWMKILQKLG